MARKLKPGDLAAITGPLRWDKVGNSYRNDVALTEYEFVEVLEPADLGDYWVRGLISGNEQYIHEGSLSRVKVKR